MHAIVPLTYANDGDETLIAVSGFLRACNASATLVHIIDANRLERYGDPSLFESVEALRDHARSVVVDMLERAAAMSLFESSKIDVECRMGQGEVTGVLELAEERNADLLIVPVFRQNQPEWLEAGFAASLLRRSDRPTLVLPQ